MYKMLKVALILEVIPRIKFFKLWRSVWTVYLGMF